LLFLLTQKTGRKEVNKLPVTVMIDPGKHQHPIPPGMYQLLRKLVKLARLGDGRKFKMGPSVLGTHHQKGISVVKVSRDSSIELNCQPGDNKSMRVMWLILMKGEVAEELLQRLKKVAPYCHPDRPVRKRCWKSESKESFRELLARAVPEGGQPMAEDADNTNIRPIMAEPQGEADTVAGDDAGGTSAGAETATTQQPTPPKKHYAGSPAADVAWVRRAVEAHLKATGNERRIKAAFFGQMLKNGLELKEELTQLRGTINALCNRGYWTRIYFQNDPNKALSFYELTDKAMSLVGAKSELDVVKPRIERVVALIEKAKPIIELETRVAVLESQIKQLKAEIEVQPEEVKKARELLRLLDELK